MRRPNFVPRLSALANFAPRKQCVEAATECSFQAAQRRDHHRYVSGFDLLDSPGRQVGQLAQPLLC